MSFEKFQYNEYEDDVVRLENYYLLEQYAVLDFSSKHNDKVTSIEFFVVQYNDEEELINRVRIKSDNFVFNEDNTFTPRVKVLLDSKFSSLEVYVVDAIFESSTLVEGVIEEDDVEEDEIIEDVFEVKRTNNISKIYTMFISAVSIILLVVIIIYFVKGVNTNEYYIL